MIGALKAQEGSLQPHPTLQAMAALAGELTPWPAEGADRADGAKGRKAQSSAAASSLKASGLARHTSPLRPYMLEELAGRFAERCGAAGAIRAGDQQDAQEFLAFLVDAMHAELAALARERGPAAAASTPPVEAPAADDGEAWLTRAGRRTIRQNEIVDVASPASALFQGRMASCISAHGAPPSVTIQPFVALGLHILHPAVRSVEDALDELTAAETVTGYRPARDAAPTTASKTLRIKSLPHLLTLHLMRYEFGSDTGANKVAKRVTFQPRLVISPRWLAAGSKEPKNAVFELIATVTHKGALSSSGHYTADVRHPSGR